MVPQLNHSTTVKGFSPTPWVLGYQPQLPGLVVNPSQLDASMDFWKKLELQASAAKAIMDGRFHQALLRQSHLSTSVFSVGQRVF